MNYSVSLATYIADWMKTYKAIAVRQSTYDRMETSAKALEGYSIADMAICDITPIHIQRYVNELANSGYRLSTIKKQLRIITAPLKQAAALHIISADPARSASYIDAKGQNEKRGIKLYFEIGVRPAIWVRSIDSVRMG